MGEDRTGNETHSESLGGGLVRRKGWNEYWKNCTEAYVNAQSDEYIIAEEQRGSTGEYSDTSNPDWYQKLSGNGYSLDYYWLNQSQERQMESVSSTGGEISREQCGASGGGGDEVVAGVTMLCAKQLSSISDLGVTNTDANSVDLSWSYSDGNQTGLRIYKSKAKGSTYSDYTKVKDISATATSTTVSNLDGGQDYYFRVVPFHDGGQGPLSNEVSTTTPELVFPASPTALSVTNLTSSSADLVWTDNATKEDGYRVYVSTDGGSTFTQDGGDLAADTSSYSLSGLTHNTDYVVKVVAFATLGEATDDHVDSGTMTVSGTKTVKYTEIVQL